MISFGYLENIEMYYLKNRLIQAGCSSENIQIVEEATAVLQFCLHNTQDKGVTSLDDRCNRKFLIVECEGWRV